MAGREEGLGVVEVGARPAGEPLATRLEKSLSILGAGIFLSRLFMEVAPWEWSWPLFLGALAAAIALGAALVGLLARSGLGSWPLLSLYGYVFYPRISPSLGLTIGAVALVLLLASHLGWVRAFPLEALVIVAASMLYIRTLAPGLLPADAAEFQLAPYVLGIAHPPGYPLYTLLGKVFTFLPVGDVAYRMNLFSALWAVLTLALVAGLVYRSLGSKLGGMLAALALASIPTFWAQATTANIRSLSAFFTALLIYLLAVPSPPRVVAFSFALGLALTHHGSLGFLLIPGGLYLLLRVNEWIGVKRLALAALGFLASLLVLLYIPIRGAMMPPLAPPGLDTRQGFLSHVLARGFAGDMFSFARPDALPERLRVGWQVLRLELGWPLLGLAALGALVLVLSRPRELVLVGGAFAVNFFVAITYRAPQTVEYLMPSYVALALLIGFGVAGMMKALWQPRLAAGVAAVLLILAGSRLASFFPSFAELHLDDSTREFAETTLSQAPENAVILANWHYTMPLLYLQHCQGLRPDVEVRYIYPQGYRPLNELWEEAALAERGKRPVVITSRRRIFELSHRLVPLGEASLVVEGPQYAVPEDLTWLGERFEERIEFLGYRLISGSVEPGQALELHLYWRPLQEMKEEPSFFFHLLDASGKGIAQEDLHPNLAGLSPGEVRVERLHIPLPVETAPGEYRLIGGVYIPLGPGKWQRFLTPEGKDSAELLSLAVPVRSSPSLSASSFRALFAGGLELLGADYHLGGTEDGDKLYLHWRYAGDGAISYQFRLFSGGEPVGDQRLDFPAPGYLVTAQALGGSPQDLALELRDGGGKQVPLLGPGKWPRSARLKLPKGTASARFVQFEEEMTLTDLQTHWSPSSGELVVELDFLALRPILRDYAISPQLVEVKGQWSAQKDSTPVDGAIPTLKWLGGMRLSDRHKIELPEGAKGGDAAELWLTVYDAFQGETLGERVQIAKLVLPPE